MDFTIKSFDITTSTNDLIKREAAAGAKEGLVITAGEQTSGRGRQGRSFISPRGGLYLSLLIRPDSTEYLTAMTAVAARRAISSLTGADIGIKWPNDLYLNGKKISGILTESSYIGSGAPEYVIIGIGINVRHYDFGEELSRTATTLEDERYFADKNELLELFLKEFDKIYTTMKRNRSWLDEYVKYSLVIGRNVTVISGGGSYTAVAEGIDEFAHLTVKRPDGSRQTLLSGEISIRL